jgi:hypothetical protein
MIIKTIGPFSLKAQEKAYPNSKIIKHMVIFKIIIIIKIKNKKDTHDFSYIRIQFITFFLFPPLIKMVGEGYQL